MLKKSLPLLLLLTAACGAAQPEEAPPSRLIGNYHYAGNGKIAGRFPWQAKANLVLDHDRQYTLAVTVHVDDDNGGDADTDESYGTYRVVGDRLILEPVNDKDSGDLDVFEIRGQELVPKLGWPVRLALKGFKVPGPVFVKSD